MGLGSRPSKSGGPVIDWAESVQLERQKAQNSLQAQTFYLPKPTNQKLAIWHYATSKTLVEWWREELTDVEVQAMLKAKIGLGSKYGMTSRIDTKKKLFTYGLGIVKNVPKQTNLVCWWLGGLVEVQEQYRLYFIEAWDNHSANPQELQPLN